MTRQEFIEAHGELAWRTLVEPLQQNSYPTSRFCERCRVQHCNANLLVHCDIQAILRLAGLKSRTLLEAAKETSKVAEKRGDQDAPDEQQKG